MSFEMIACMGIFAVLMMVVIYFGLKSRLQFSKYLMNMNEKEKEDWLNRNTRFVFIQSIVVAVGFLGILVALLMGQNSLAGYTAIGLLVLLILIAIIGNFTIYHVPKD